MQFTFARTIFLALMLSIPGIACLADIPISDGPTSSSLDIVSEDTLSFFSGFQTKSQPPAKSPFETDEQYKAKLPQWDNTKIIYFVVKCNGNPGDASSNPGGAYDYDIKKHDLIIASGGKQDYTCLYYSPKGTTPVILYRNSENSTYVGHNAFGADVSVNEFTTTDYSVYLHDVNHLPKDTFSKNFSWFVFHLKRDPDAAKELVSHVAIVIGVRPLGYGKAYDGFADGKIPTYDDPTDVTHRVSAIEANLVSVMLIDTGHNLVIGKYLVK